MIPSEHLSERRLAISVISDDPVQSNAEITCLHGHGYSVKSVEKSTDIYSIVYTSNVVLINFRLKEECGYVFAKKIRSISSEVGILMIISLDQLEATPGRKVFSSGVDNYLTRPYDCREMAVIMAGMARRFSVRSKSK